MSDEIKRQYVNYLFFKVDPAWRRLSRDERDRGKSEFEGVVKDWKGRALLIPFSTVGTRADTDFLLWRISERLEDFTEMSTQLLNTNLGKWCQTPYSYLGMTKRSMYVDHHEHEGSEGRRGRVVPGQNKYIFVYPFWKTSDWYLLPKEERQRMMNVHIETGHRYPSIKINTIYCFGLDDPEFVVAFEGDKPEDFIDLVMEMREHEVRKYTLRDTPIFTCIRGSIGEVLGALG
ncbi:MAG: chlorite dismutase family protein [Verrucomicrobiia bacterium]|jgi:chlorite dismutase